MKKMKRKVGYGEDESAEVVVAPTQELKRMCIDDSKGMGEGFEEEEASASG